MSSTNKTTNYELSQFVGADKPTYLGDYNSDMLKIDTQMKNNADNIASVGATATTANATANTALADASTAQTTANNANTSASNASQVATQALSKATSNETKITALESLNVYSTTEKVVGTWIDGKPVYQKTLSGTCDTNGTQVIDGTITTTLDVLINSFGEVKNEQYTQQFQLGSYLSADYNCSVDFNESLGLRLHKGNQLRHTQDTYNITILYTKITDVAPTV